MKIAIPTAQGLLCPHFGHCEHFTVFEIEDSKIIDKSEIVPPPHEPGVLPKWLHEHGVNVIIAGGMGQRAQQFFNNFGIQVIIGANSSDPEEVAKSYIAGTLESGENICDH